MLQEAEMEKKNASRNQQVSTRGALVEAKAASKQDGGNGKTFPKTAHGRDPSAVVTSRPRAKPASQKGKNSDKKPRPRGQYSKNTKDGGQVTEVLEPEYGSVQNPGSKKPNANHLLNFHFPCREGAHGINNWRSPPNGYNRGRMNHSKGNGGMRKSNLNTVMQMSHLHKYKKEHFIQANCQFLVQIGNDYSQHAKDPDLMVAWNYIEQIRMRSAEMPTCPICLSPPVAAKMTRCGHIYCWSCILHYLSLSDRDSRNCPICDEQIRESHLKSAVTLSHVAIGIGNEIQFNLMRRDRNSLLAMPVHSYDSEVEKTLTRYGNDALPISSPLSNSAKIVTATAEEVKSVVLDLERVHLELQLQEENGPEACYIESALNKLDEREANLNVRFLTEGKSDIETAVKVSSDVLDDTCEHLAYKCAFENVHDEEEELAVAVDTLLHVDGRERRTSSESSSSSSSTSHMDSKEEECKQLVPPHYFYQVWDGQNIFLHSLNIQMLIYEYGSLERCPPILKVRILERTQASMTEELRARLRYAAHLPLSCPFEIVEIELVEPLFHEKTKQHFAAQLSEHQKRREKRANSERRREKQIADVENRLWGRYPGANINIASRNQFPESFGCNANNNFDEMEFPIPVPGRPPAPKEGGRSLACALPAANGMSFARITRDGNHGPPVAAGPVFADTSNADDDVLRAPDYRRRLFDDIEFALQKAATASPGSNGNRKKGKKKSVLLFTTSGTGKS